MTSRPLLRDLRPEAWRPVLDQALPSADGLPRSVQLEDAEGTRLHVSWSTDGEDWACVHLLTWMPGADSEGAPALIPRWQRLGAVRCLRNLHRWPKARTEAEAIPTALAWLDLHLGAAAQGRRRAVAALLAALCADLPGQEGDRLTFSLSAGQVRRLRTPAPGLPPVAEPIAQAKAWSPPPNRLLGTDLPIGEITPEGLALVDRVSLPWRPMPSAHARAALRQAAAKALAAYLPQALPWLDAGLEPC